MEHSAAAGALDPRYYRNLATALELETLTVGDIVSRTSALTTVSADAGAAAIQAMSRLTGHQRILVQGDDQTATGVVHVRDSLRADPETRARDLMRPVLRLGSELPVYRALHLMRQTRNHLAMVVDADEFVGLITLTDVLQRLLPETGAAA